MVKTKEKQAMGKKRFKDISDIWTNDDKARYDEFINKARDLMTMYFDKLPQSVTYTLDENFLDCIQTLREYIILCEPGYKDDDEIDFTE